MYVDKKKKERRAIWKVHASAKIPSMCREKRTGLLITGHMHKDVLRKNTEEKRLKKCARNTEVYES